MAAAKAPARAKRDTRKAWQDALTKVMNDAAKSFPDHVGKLDQLRFHLDTAAMVVDDLHDTTPYRPNN